MSWWVIPFGLATRETEGLVAGVLIAVVVFLLAFTVRVHGELRALSGPRAPLPTAPSGPTRPSWLRRSEATHRWGGLGTPYRDASPDFHGPATRGAAIRALLCRLPSMALHWLASLLPAAVVTASVLAAALAWQRL